MKKYEAGTRRAELDSLAHRAALTIRTYSPGDGITRYKFFKETVGPDQDYFGPENGIHTALGISDAFTFLHGVRVGQDYHA